MKKLLHNLWIDIQLCCLKWLEKKLIKRINEIGKKLTKIQVKIIEISNKHGKELEDRLK